LAPAGTSLSYQETVLADNEDLPAPAGKLLAYREMVLSYKEILPAGQETSLAGDKSQNQDNPVSLTGWDRDKRGLLPGNENERRHNRYGIGQRPPFISQSKSNIRGLTEF
jgi:hypothetical protein